MTDGEEGAGFPDVASFILDRLDRLDAGLITVDKLVDEIMAKHPTRDFPEEALRG